MTAQQQLRDYLLKIKKQIINHEGLKRGKYIFLFKERVRVATKDNVALDTVIDLIDEVTTIERLENGKF